MKYCGGWNVHKDAQSFCSQATMPLIVHSDNLRFVNLHDTNKHGEGKSGLTKRYDHTKVLLSESLTKRNANILLSLRPGLPASTNLGWRRLNYMWLST